MADTNGEPANGTDTYRLSVILILLDDVGFGATSTFGGPVPTPTGDRRVERTRFGGLIGVEIGPIL